MRATEGRRLCANLYAKAAVATQKQECQPSGPSRPDFMLGKDCNSHSYSSSAFIIIVLSISVCLSYCSFSQYVSRLVVWASIIPVSFFFFYFFTIFLFPAKLIPGRVYPQRCSGQAVVTGVPPFPPLYVRAFIFISHRVRHSHCSSNSSNCTNSRFPLRVFILFCEKKFLRVRVCTP